MLNEMSVESMSNPEEDYCRVVNQTGPTRFHEQTTIEVVREVHLEHPPEHVLFDFDGTLSLVREGWPEIMVPMMVETLLEMGTQETADELSKLVYAFVMKLNGKQTIYQMIQLAEEIEKRGGTPQDPQFYKDRYHELLMKRISHRREDLSTGRISPDDMMVPGALALLNQLKAKGANLYLASGTDENYVKEEVALLKIDSYFGPHVYGALKDYKAFSKAQVIQRILGENSVPGSRLLGFGDGYVEIQNVKASGGTAVAVASDESGRSGKPDPWKRDRLIGVGADFVIPDYQHANELVSLLWA